MPTTKQLPVTLIIRNATAQNWTTRNPVLAEGEFGLETNTFLIKMGDGVTTWNNLRYLNKLDPAYFKTEHDGTLTFSDEFKVTLNNLIINAGGSATIIIPNDPVNPTDPVNLRYLEWAIAHAGHLKRAVVQSLPTQDIDENTLYMVLSQAGTYYDEYMYINGQWDMVGTTGDNVYELPVATTERLGGVKASASPDRINVTQEGFMTLNTVSTSLLYVPDGDTLILYGGTA